MGLFARRFYYNERLSSYDFSELVMDGTIFTGCDLDGCSFDGAKLVGSIFRNCDLTGANFCNADLALSIFFSCGLRDAKFDGAGIHDITFSCCYLADTYGLKNLPMRCPEMGGFIAWKKCYVNECTPVLVKLFIPSSAKRSSAGGNKCRASKAKVLSITDIRDASITYDHCFSNRYPPFEYKVGWYVEPDGFDENRWEECSNGIHFFMSRQEAIDYI